MKNKFHFVSGLLLIFFLSTSTLGYASVLTDQYFKEGRQLLHKGEYKIAIEKFKVVLRHDKNYLKVYASMGMAYLKLGNREMANKYFNRTKKNITLIHSDNDAPLDNGDSHFKKGEHYYRKSMFKKAINEYSLALKRNKKDYLIYFSMGAAYKKLGDIYEAYKKWELALTYNPKDRLIKKLISKLKNEIAMADQIEKLKKDKKTDPKNSTIMLSLAKIYIDNQQYKKAKRELNAAMSVDPNNKDAYMGLASLKSAQGQFDDAIVILEEYLLTAKKKDESVKAQMDMIYRYKNILKTNRFYTGVYTGDLSKEMVFVPEGKFYMGSSKGNVETGIDESPEHVVYVDSFFIDTYEVTNKQYQTFIVQTGHEFPFHWRDPNSSHEEKIPFEDTYYPKEGDYYPVSYVAWSDADAYCRWAGKRLPTEEEWEKAARGTDKRGYPWGNRFEKFKANTALSHFKGPTPIGSYPKGVSPYGVYDMAGNVWEWTNNWYKRYKGSQLKRDSFGEKFRVVRGGSFLDPPLMHIRTSERHAELPTMKHRSIGFRCASDKKQIVHFTPITY